MTNVFTATIKKGKKVFTPHQLKEAAESKLKTAKQLRTIGTVLTVVDIAVAVLAKEQATKVRAIVALVTTLASLGIIQGEIEATKALKKYAEKSIEEINKLNEEFKQAKACKEESKTPKQKNIEKLKQENIELAKKYEEKREEMVNNFNQKNIELARKYKEKREKMLNNYIDLETVIEGLEERMKNINSI